MQNILSQVVVVSNELTNATIEQIEQIEQKHSRTGSSG